MRLWGKFLPLAAAATLWVGADVASLAAQATGSVTGTVVDETSGRTLESAQVFLPALNTGGLSNQQGRFILLNIPAGTYEMRVELIGYTSATQQVTVTAGQATTVEFRLASTALKLQELVVTGVAGSTPRVKLPFTVEKVDFTDMPVPAPSVDGLIAGKVPGAKVVHGSGQPGSDSDILLRGPTTITGSQDPLIIIDGVITNNTLADISSLDVESIEIVKGAAASSLYGSRAQNGVVQIRTKRGTGLSIDQARITIRNEVGQSDLESSFPFSRNHSYAMSGGQIVDFDGNPIDVRFYHDVNTGAVCDPVQDPLGTVCTPPNPALNGGSSSKSFQDQQYPSNYTLYDHIKRFYNAGTTYSGYVAVEGRTGTTNYRASFVHQLEQGVVPENDGFKLNGLRLNLDHQVLDNLNVSLSTYYSKSRQEDLGGSPFFNITFQAPFADLAARAPGSQGVAPCPAEGCYVWKPDPLSAEENPLYRLQLIDLQDSRQRFLGSANVNFTPLSWFELEGNFSLDQSNSWQNNQTPAGVVSDQSGPGRGNLNKSQSHRNQLNTSLTASINKSFGDLTTRTKVRYLLEDQHNESFSVSGNEFAAKNVPSFDNIAGEFTAGSSISDIISEGFFFITAFDYQGKYVGDVMVRRDGSSLFGAKERWQTYYRASGAWRLAQESWWPFDNLNEFKIRYSIGTAGGRPGFSSQYETYSVSQGVISPRRLGNNLLKPELDTEQEVGLETVFFNKVNAGVTYAWSKVEDQLLSIPLPGFVGFSSQWQNAGTLESNTWEGFVEASLVERPNFGWTSRVNIDATNQEITKLNRAPYRTSFFFIREGEALGTFYGSRWASSCGDLLAGTDCSEFQVNDDGLLVWVGAGNGYTDGISKDLWGSSGDVAADPDEDGNPVTKSYKWGLPIEVNTGPPDNNFQRLGSTTPDFNLSWSNTFRWSNLSLYALFDGEFGADIYNQTRQWAYREKRSGDQDQFGKADGLKKSVDYYQTLYNTNANSGWFVESATYVKLRELSLRYTMDQSLVDRLFGNLGVSSLALNLIGRNVFTITDFTGYDPEVANGNSSVGSEAIGRVDNFGYPNFRTLSASLEIIF